MVSYSVAFKFKIFKLSNFREKCLDKESMGLVTLPKVSIISEYKVVREILWQLWVPHVSTVFEFDINNIQVKKNITVSSVTLVSGLRMMKTINLKSNYLFHF